MLIAIPWALALEQVIQVIFAAAVGAMFGYEREIKNKPAGFLTFMLVSIGACVIAILQTNVRRSQPEADGARLIAQVVSGIGFLGAGTIIHTRATVKGITTAAMLWVIAALGILIGSGSIYTEGGILNYIIAGVVSLIVLPLSYLFRDLSETRLHNKQTRRLSITYDEVFEAELYETIKKIPINVKKSFLMNKHNEGKVTLKEVIIYVKIPKSKTLSDVIDRLAEAEYVRSVEEA